MNWLDVTALVLVVIGALNWGLVGFFNYNLVGAIFGDATLMSRIVYALVGLAGLVTIRTAVKAGQEATQKGHTPRAM